MKVALYARVSTLTQERERTIESQLAELKSYVSQQGYKLEAEHIYVDDGYSGSQLNRPGLDRLREDAQTGAFRGIVILSPDRLARHYAYQFLLIEEFKQLRCQVIFCSQPLSDQPEEKLLQQVQSVFAEYERSRIQKRMVRGKAYKVRQGRFLPWSNPPYGYRYHPITRDQAGYATIHEEEARIVRQVFQWYVNEGLSSDQIAERLNRLGVVPRKQGKGWSPASIRDMLRNETYIGKAYFNRYTRIPAKSPRRPGQYVKHAKYTKQLRPRSEWIELPVPPLIDGPLFAQAQVCRHLNAERAKRNNRHHEYLLRCLVRCGPCGYKMNGRQNSKYHYYACRRGRNLIETHRTTKCTSRSIRQDYLDAVVWRETQQLLTQPQLLALQFERQQTSLYAQEPSYQYQQLEKQLRGWKGQIQRLIDAYQEQVITLNQLQTRKAQLEERISQGRQQLHQYQQEAHQVREKQEVLKTLQIFCRQVSHQLNQATFETKRKLIELLVEEVTVTDDQVAITYIFPLDPHSHLYLDDRGGPSRPETAIWSTQVS